MLIIRYLAPYIWFLYATSLWGRTHLSIEPVKIIRSKQKITLVYWLDCGAEFEGVIIRPEGGGRKIGILSRRTDQRCLSLPQKQEFILSDIMVIDETPLTSLNPIYERKGIRWVPLNHRMLRSKDTHNDLLLSFTLFCNNSVGVVLRTGGPDSLKVGLLGRRSRSCHRDLAHAKLKGVRPHFQQLELFNTRKPLAYQTYITSIKKGSAYRTKDGRTAFRFLRRCNEAPIGILKRHRHFAIVVARYPQSICPPKTYPKSWTPYRTRLFSPEMINNSLPLSTHAVEVVSPFRITTPSSQSFSYDTDINCNSYQGTIFREERQTILVASALSRRQEPCKISPIRLSLKLSGLADLDTKWQKLRLEH